MYGRGPQIGFGPPATPDVIKALIAANAVVYVAETFTSALVAQFAIRPSAVFERGAIWQLFTYMWLHASPLHLIFNMLSLWMFGSPVAMAWGARRFLRFYLICGVGAGAVIAAWPGLLELLGVATTSYLRPTVGASGAVYGVLLAFSLLWPDRTIMLLFPPIPLKAIWFIPFLVFMELIWWNPGVSTLGHLGGVATGYIALRAMGLGGRASLGQIKWRLKRWRMRRQLRAVRMEELRERQRERDRRNYH